MKSEIYYFSGTGNSLFVAKQLAHRLNSTLIPIASVINRKTVAIDSDAIGIAFPTYFATFGEIGIPFIVQRFVAKLSGIENKYIFAVCTHGGVPGSTIQSLSELIGRNGGILSVGYAIRMSISYSTFDKMRYALFNHELPNEINEDGRRHSILYGNCERKLQEIVHVVGNQKRTKLQTSSLRSTPFKLLRKMALSRYKNLSGMASDSFEYVTKNADRALVVGNNCDRCGICAKVCPAGNIILNNNRPEWQHNCQNCYACFTWCPKVAIQGDLVEYERQYHHPEIKVTDMFWRDCSPAIRDSSSLLTH